MTPSHSCSSLPGIVTNVNLSELEPESSSSTVVPFVLLHLWSRTFFSATARECLRLCSVFVFATNFSHTQVRGLLVSSLVIPARENPVVLNAESQSLPRRNSPFVDNSTSWTRIRQSRPDPFDTAREQIVPNFCNRPRKMAVSPST